MQVDGRELPRLNPFAFPSETEGRFLMLIVAALAFAANLGCVILPATGLSPDFSSRAETIEKIHQHWLYYMSTREEFLFGPAEQAAFDQIALLLSMEMNEQIKRIAGPILSMVFLVTVAFIIFRRHPQRLRLRLGSSSLTMTEAPRVVADIQNCADRLGLHRPSLEYRPGLLQGQTYGFRGREVLVLSGSPATLERSWGRMSRAIVLHELAHVAHGDAGDREKTIAVWRAVLFLLATQSVILAFFDVILSGIFFFNTLLMLILVRTIAAGLIRAREFYADWRVSLWGAGPDLDRMFRSPDNVPEPWERWHWWWWAWNRWGDRTWWRIVWQVLEKIGSLRKRWTWFHPPFAERRRALFDHAQLFHLSPDLSFLVGLLIASLAAGTVMFLFEIFITLLQGENLVFALTLKLLASRASGSMREVLALLASLVFYIILIIPLAVIVVFGISYLVTRTVGVQVQRQTMAQLVMEEPRARSYIRLLKAALLFAFGMELGFSVAPFSISLPLFWADWLIPISFYVIGCAFFIWLYLIYAYELSRSLLGSHTGREIPWRRQRIVTWASAAVLTMIYWSVLIVRFMISCAFLMSMGESGPMGMNPRETFAFEVTVTITVVVLTLLGFSAWVLGSWLLLRSGPMRRSVSCPFCRRATSHWMGVGRYCEQCGRALAPWLFIEADASALSERCG